MDTLLRRIGASVVIDPLLGVLGVAIVLVKALFKTTLAMVVAFAPLVGAGLNTELGAMTPTGDGEPASIDMLLDEAVDGEFDTELDDSLDPLPSELVL